jgi:hypothetical protein
MPWVRIGNGKTYKYGFPQYWAADRGKAHVVTANGSISICGHVGNYLYQSALGDTPEDACQNCIRMLGEPNIQIGWGASE